MPIDIRGFEYDWLACDQDGHVALFSTAGGGVAPAAFLADIDAHDDAIDRILALPARARPLAAPVLAPGLENTWALVAERGLFAYDGDLFGRPYQRVGVPSVSIHIDDLPPTIRGVVLGIRLSVDCFADVVVIFAEDFPVAADGTRSKV